MIWVLALNSSYVPIEIVTWKRAVSLLFAEKAKVIAEYEDKFVRSPSIKMAIPSIILLTETTKTPRFVTTVPFNRRNIFLRDGGRCAYCGCKVSMGSFTLDHVVPKYFGGETSWSNLVVSCSKCNGKKGSKPLKSSGMSLVRQPYVPRLTKAAPLSIVSDLGLDISGSISHESWRQYIYWDFIRN